MKNIIAILILLIFLVSCKGKTFDSNSWKNDDPTSYPERRNMVNNLIRSKTLLNLTDSAITKILGVPTQSDTTAAGKVELLHYTVRISFGFDIDPVYIETLRIKFDTVSNKCISTDLVKSTDKRNLIEKLITE